MHPAALLCCTLLQAAAPATAQPPRVQVGENVLVGRESPGKVLIEPHLAAHPTDPGHLLAVGWLEVASSGSGIDAGSHCATFVSRDAGRSWKRNDVAGLWCSDPWVTLSSRGAVLTAMGSHASLPDTSKVQTLAWFSGDGGTTWSTVPQSLGRSHDGPRSIADSAGRVYVTSGRPRSEGSPIPRFGVFVGRAQPGVAHVETLNHIVPSTLNLNADDLAVLPDGRLVITYHDFGRSIGGRMTFAGALTTRRVWAMVSSDRGLTFSLPMMITESCFDRPSDLAVDGSTGANRGRLYLVCATKDLQSIAITHSSDGAQEWVAAKPIEVPATQTRQRSAAQVAVNKDGVVAVAWMDRRDDATGRCYAPYVAASADGGQTFSAPVKVASQLSCPDSAKSGAFTVRRWPVGGDYFGLAAAADGRFHLVWPDARSGDYQVWSASVSVSAGQR